jgi:hypothetical protein
MNSPDIGYLTPTEMPVAYDNGMYRVWQTGALWDAERWAEWLMRQPRGLFAVVPDVPTNAKKTRTRFQIYAPFVARHQPVAYALQDGSDSVTPPWDEFDVLFVGGTNGFRYTEVGWRMVLEAKARGKWVHIGRVNTLRALLACRAAQVDSVDGTRLAFGSDLIWPQLCRWLDQCNRQQTLAEVW